MSRVDVPTLKCDRCGITTQDANEMSRWQTLEHRNLTKVTKWDLCLTCWNKFQTFVNDDGAVG